MATIAKPPLAGTSPLPSPQELQPYLDFALDLAKKAGDNTKPWFDGIFAVELKDDQSPVTVADRETESLCRSIIEQRYPTHGIIGEEWGNKTAASPWTWTIDPIDGTKSFISALPLYTFLLSLMHDGRPVLGIIHQPILNQTAWGARGLGAFYNNAPAKLRDCDSLSKAWLLCTDPSHLIQQRPKTVELLKQVALSRSWGDGYGYLMLLAGRADIMLDPAMHLWDIAALKPIFEEAGAAFVDMEGERQLGISALACNKTLLPLVLPFLKV